MSTRMYKNHADYAMSVNAHRSVLVPSYDHPTLWEGHASMVEEMEKQLPQEVKKPDAIFCSVGGGGLLGGVIVGCNQVGWQDGKPLATVL